MRAYSAAQAELEHAGGYSWRSRLESILRGLGFAEADHDRDLRTFSGGELTRASLARALAMRPDLLLLDEPTNHLDLTSLEWLERELQSLDISVVLVSHDRWFLEAVATGVVELEAGRARVFEGRYSAYRKEKALAIAQQAEAFERQQAELERLQRFVDKFRAGTRSRQAASRAKRIERIELVDRPRQQRSLAFGFPKTVRPGRDVLEVEDARVEAGDKLLVRKGDVRDRARPARRADRPERHGQDLAGRVAARRAAHRRRQGADGPQRRPRRTSRSTRRSCRPTRPCSRRWPRARR